LSQNYVDGGHAEKLQLLGGFVARCVKVIGKLQTWTFKEERPNIPLDRRIILQIFPVNMLSLDKHETYRKVGDLVGRIVCSL
jgi:hypothetical protein